VCSPRAGGCRLSLANEAPVKGGPIRFHTTTAAFTYDNDERRDPR